MGYFCGMSWPVSAGYSWLSCWLLSLLCARPSVCACVCCRQRQRRPLAASTGSRVATCSARSVDLGEEALAFRPIDRPRTRLTPSSASHPDIIRSKIKTAFYWRPQYCQIRAHGHHCDRQDVQLHHTSRADYYHVLPIRNTHLVGTYSAYLHRAYHSSQMFSGNYRNRIRSLPCPWTQMVQIAVVVFSAGQQLLHIRRILS